MNGHAEATKKNKQRNCNYTDWKFKNGITFDVIISTALRHDLDIPRSLELLNLDPIDYGYVLVKGKWIWK